MSLTRQLPPADLIATLGTEPQVITVAFALLARRGKPPGAVTVIHTTGPQIDPAVQVLRRVFPSSASPAPPAGPSPAENPPQPGSLTPIEPPVPTAPPVLTTPPEPPGMPGLPAPLEPPAPLPPLRLVPILDPSGRALPDVDTPEAGAAAFRCLYTVLRQAKRAGRQVHLLIAGGRKSMALYGMAAAQLLFDPGDCLWHLHSAGDLLTSKRLFPQPGDDVHLARIPVLLWGPANPLAAGLEEIDDPFQAAELVRRRQFAERAAQARAYIRGSLTPAEERAVALLVAEGLSDEAIAARLSLSARTVESQLRSAYRKAADHWELDDLNRAGLIALLGPYYWMEEPPGAGADFGVFPDAPPAGP